MNSKVVLKACSTAEMQRKMVSREWKRTSNAAILGADVDPKGLEFVRTEPTVTATILAAMPALAKESEPYTFTVTAKFKTGDRITTNTASATLHINYVSSWGVFAFCRCV